MYSGKISLKVMTASNLPNKHQTLNPYVQVKVDGLEVFKTTSVQDTVNPTWNENKEFYRENVQYISFSLHHDDAERDAS